MVYVNKYIMDQLNIKVIMSFLCSDISKTLYWHPIRTDAKPLNGRHDCQAW